MIYLVNYANEKFYKRQKKLNKSALKFGIDKTISWTREMLEKTDFYKNNKKVLDQPRAAGYNQWKPFIIYETLKYLNEGDILFYVDSGAEFISEAKPLIELCNKEKIVLFTTTNIQLEWTKRDCFVKMNCDTPMYWNAFQIMAGYQIYEKNERTMNFIRDVLDAIQIDGIVDDSPSKYANFDSFKEHRHDQSVLTNIATRYGIIGFRNPSQGGNHLKKKELRVNGEMLNYPYSDNPDERSNYPTIFFNKRSASNLKIALIKLMNKFQLNKLRGKYNG